jgi:hypothetical protein
MPDIEFDDTGMPKKNNQLKEIMFLYSIYLVFQVA